MFYGFLYLFNILMVFYDYCINIKKFAFHLLFNTLIIILTIQLSNGLLLIIVIKIYNFKVKTESRAAILLVR